MAFKVLIVEDAPTTGSTLREYLESELVRLAADEDHPPWTNERTVVQYELGPGQFRHLLPSTLKVFEWGEYCVAIVPTTSLSALIESSRGELRGVMTELCRKAFRASGAQGPLPDIPDLLIVDLALNQTEARLLRAAGGTVDAGDPRPALNEMTGFRIIQEYGGVFEGGTHPHRCSVIATTLASNPHVAVHCLENGASAVIRKPFQDRVVRTVLRWEQAHTRLNPAALEELADHGSDTNAVKLRAYLRAVAAEVLKLSSIMALARSQTHLPRGLARDMIVEPTRFEPRSCGDAGLLLLRVAGLPRLLELGARSPRGIFAVLGRMWSAVQAKLDDFDASISYFHGDGALALQGMDGGISFQEDLPNLVGCALSILNTVDTPAMRSTLCDIVRVEYRTSDAAKLSALIQSKEFGLHIAVASLRDGDADGVLGVIGSEARGQYALVSPYVKWLGTLARRGRLMQESPTTGGTRAFLLWKKDRDVPCIPGIRLEPINESVLPAALNSQGWEWSEGLDAFGIHLVDEP